MSAASGEPEVPSTLDVMREFGWRQAHAVGDEVDVAENMADEIIALRARVREVEGEEAVTVLTNLRLYAESAHHTEGEILFLREVAATLEGVCAERDLCAQQRDAAVGERAECVAREQRWLARLAACEGERDAELKRRQFMQVYGRVMGWGFNSVEEMDAEGVAAAGVCVSDEREPYRSRKLVFVRYSEFGGDKARTEAEAIDRAIRITEELDTTDDFGPNDGHTRTGNRSAWQEGKV